MTSSVAEFFSLLTYLPIDIIRTRLQVNDCHYQYRSIYSGLEDIARKEGILRVYKASHLYMINYVTLTAIQFWTFENLRQILINRGNNNSSSSNNNSLSLYESIPLSLFSTSLATLITSPIDIVFTRQQLLNTSEENLNGR